MIKSWKRYPADKTVQMRKFHWRPTGKGAKLFPQIEGARVPAYDGADRSGDSRFARPLRGREAIRSLWRMKQRPEKEVIDIVSVGSRMLVVVRNTAGEAS
jgi:hypothetical protein